MRFAVLGLGSIGSRHAGNLLRLDHEVVGFDLDAQRPAPPGASRAATAQEALRDADAAIVATPTSLHGAGAVDALRAGVPVLVEKPLAPSPDEAAAICALARERGVICGVAMNLRFHPAVLELRRLIGEGALGRLLYARVSSGSDLRGWRPGTDYRESYSARRELGGGVLLDSIHELDYLTWLLGPAASVSAELARVSDLEIDVEDLVLATLKLRSGALAQLDLNYFETGYRRGCLLVGARASAAWDWSRGTIEISHGGAAGGGEAGTVIDVGRDVDATYVDEVRQFADAVRRGEAPRTTAEQGLEVVRLAAALRRSAEAGRRVTIAADAP